MSRVEIYLGLGSNEGDRDLNLIRAMNLLDEAFGMHPERISSIVSSPAWGFEGPDFLNLCVMYRPQLEGEPVEQCKNVLRIAKTIERQLGREEKPLMDENGKRIYSNRPIDIDILLFGTHVIQTEELTVPHPLIGQRDFVKKPLLEISKPDIRKALSKFVQIKLI